MKALFVGSYPNAVEPFRSVFFKQLICQFAEQGVECHVISPVSITAYRQKVKRIQVHTTEVLPSGKKIEVYRPHVITYSAKKIGKWNTIHLTQKSIEKAALKVVRQLDEKFDFVYGHFFLGGGLTAACIGRKFNIPAYIAYGECNFETEVSNKYGEITLEEMRGVRGIIAVSSANYDDLGEREFSKDITRLLSINAIDSKKFFVKNKKECRERLGMPQEKFIVGFVGYFIERKGPNRVQKACSNLENVYLAFAGKGELQPKGENVVFCKSLEHDMICDFLNAIDVFVLPTRNEGCCNAVLEAMACGKPIVTSDLPFNHDVLNDKNAILINPNDVNEIKDAIVNLRDSDNLRLQLSKNVLNDIKELTIEKRVAKILEFIKETNK